ncbi:sialidase family protein [Archangium gephyra]|nr:hypothetical protein [Archangium gephyra]AKJ06709.1 BNR repeat domain protein [Archangium gephyra]
MPCTSDGGWCWDNPLASGSGLRAIRGRSESDILAVGENGVVLSWDGTCWNRSRAGKQSQTLSGIWPAPGPGWQVVGINGTLLRSEDGGWVEDKLGTVTLRDISGGSDGSAFAVGSSGTLHRFVDGGWGTQSSGTSVNLTAVAAVSRNEAWAFAENGDILSYDPTFGWNRESASGVALTGAVRHPDGKPLAVGTGFLVRWVGGLTPGWRKSGIGPSTTRLNGIWHDSGRTWIVGEPGSIYQEDGGTEPSGTAQVLNSVWSQGEKAWAVGESGVIVQRTGSSWAEAPGGVVRTVHGLWSSSDGLWAVGDRGLIMRRVGGRWSTVAPPEQNVFRDVWGSGNVLWVLGESGRVYAYRDGRWTTELPGDTLTALWGVGPEQVWGVGPGGVIRRRNANGTWDTEPLNGGSSFGFNAIWGSSATELWAVGTGGNVYRRDPACTAVSCTWLKQTVTPATTAGFNDVWGTPSGKVWAVAGGGDIYHYNGSTWTNQPISGGNPGLLALTGRSESELWAVGANGSVVTGDGNTWTLQIVTGGRALGTVVVAGDTVWAGGLDGTIIKHQ